MSNKCHKQSLKAWENSTQSKDDASDLREMNEPLYDVDRSLTIPVQLSQLVGWLVSSIEIKQLTDIVFELSLYWSYWQPGCISEKITIQMNAL